MRRTALKAVMLTICLAGFAWAEQEDEPGRGVARISLINGDVSVRRGDSGDWVAAAVNAPLVVEDSVLTGPASRAEVQFDWANMIRLASNAEIRLAQLDYQRYLIQVARGTVTFRMQRNSDAEVELSTPSVSVRPVRKGTYRITVREDGESEITVRSGEAEVFTPRGSERLRSGRTMLARGTVSDPEYQIVREIEHDSWDRWNESRDRDLDRSRGYRYAHRSIYGIEDLDGYGTWVHVAPYGWVWSPRVVVGWSPYYYGRWTWIDWYGWTWMSYDPWGWAPYHYGRWFYYRPHGWCWWPGGMYVRHHWRPALVAFFGWGRHTGFHVGLGFGHVGWIPLAPYEPYYPWYGRRYYRGYRNHTYIDNSVNIVNNTNIYNIYRNARITNAVTAVDASQFGRGGGNLVRVKANEMHRAGLVKGMLPVAPRQESLRLANREVTKVNLPRSVSEGRFYSRRQPAAVDRVPFEEQRRAMERISRGSSGEAGGRVAESVRAPRQAEGASQPVRRETVRGADGNLSRVAENQRGSTGWRRVGETPAAEPQQREATQEWRRFGEPVMRRDSGSGTAMPRTMEQSRAREEIQVRGGEGSVRSVPARSAGEADTGSWRRFGEPSGAVDRSAGAVRREQTERSTVRDRAEQPSRVDPGISRRESSDGWRRFESPRSEPQRSQSPRSEPQRNQLPRSEPQRFESPRNESPRYEAPRSASPRYESPRSESRGGDRTIRISPPIVRERAEPRFGSSGGGMPRMSEPRGGRFESSGPRGGGGIRSAPAPRGSSGGVRSAPAPRGSSGGRVSGGAARSSGRGR